MKSHGKVLFLDERSHYDFIDKLFLELGKYYDAYIDITYEVPYSYSERTFVGHLAQSACRNGYYSIQDYDAVCVRVPDTCVFEAKTTHATPIDKDPEDHSQIILNKLIIANKQIDAQGLIEAQYRCALVASPVHCASIKWSKYASNPRMYDLKVNELRENIIGFLRKSDANFVWTYMLDYENIRTLTWKHEGKTYLPWVGIICAGKVQRYHSK